MSSSVNGFGGSSYEKRSKIPPILRLPPETFNAIFAYASSSDLVNLALVSKHFHGLAAAQLYRSLSHVFDERDTRTGQLAVDRLAGVLGTLTTSDYNYAAYIKEISLDAIQGNQIAASVALEFRYGSSCGKFLNTLLLATLKRIEALESFRWNVRVEISPAIFAILGKHSGLQNVHVRLQDGLSMHSSSSMSLSSSPFTFTAPAPAAVPPITHHHHHHQHHHHHHHHHHPPPPPSSTSPFLANGDLRPAKRLNTHKFHPITRNFSLFSSLRSLAVLDMDTLEYVPEVAECISSSSTTLKTLKLSFSEALALKARKKTIVDVSDTETVQEDDGGGFMNDPLIPSPAPPPPVMPQSLFGNTSTSNDADVRLERTAQEKALARLFGLEKENAVQKKLEKIADRAIADADKEIQSALKSSKHDVDRIFVKNLSSAVRGLVQSKGAYASSSKGIKALEQIEKAAITYLEKKGTVDGRWKEKLKGFTGQKHSYKAGPIQTQAGLFGTTNVSSPKSPFSFDTVPPMGYPPPPSQLPPPGKGIFSYPPKSSYPPGPSYASPGSMHKSKALHPGKPAPNWKPPGQVFIDHSSSTSDASESTFNKPFLDNTQNEAPQQPTSIMKPAEKEFEDELQDMVDIEHPDEVSDEDDEDQEFLDPNGSSVEHEIPTPHLDDELNGSQTNEQSSDSEGHASSSSCKGKQPIRGPGDTWLNSPPISVAHPDVVAMGTTEASEDAIQTYIRLHHGIPVESLSIYLIPVKPSVLCRAINLSSLKHLCLLNVGPQRPFWAMLSKLHKTTPLQLTSVHTDNVTQSLLTFLNDLSYLEEVFMVERSNRSKVEPFAPKTHVVIEDIQTQVLAKHAKHLKRLMIRNDDDSSWALNRESVMLIGKHGSVLKELVVALTSPNFHLLMQHLNGLRSLQALHILFTQSDYCPSVLREIRMCAADSVIQRPYLQVEFIAVSYAMNGPTATAVSRLERSPPCPSSRSKDGNKKMDTLFYEDDDADANVDATSRRAPGNFKGKGKEVHVSWEVDGSEDNDDDEEEEEEGKQGQVTVHDGVKFRDVTGVKVWQKEVWDLKL
ncbi:hypothetical protein AJ78_01491 [Emergomyces pasteurianus Ep9510]|uniref:F-box domain-containing protein n=1 Tax=Emergomyces pasteurianus Ep9510 TaxID=1447872 RepID=A0A1J9PQM5_9EURO|nr:hypothetical protein AJ78_01491 [Emergomyces pasteurianus Ep9510]